ncbi:etoposide-induced protein 2.4 homolog [Tetranychus urticae]|uniref:etoposide-induced protein 2.4 homolog n=1 Tax=Tetranychus urticae TaxID=32264 RepID=UPI00077BAEA2|nr:etoposide-induced protein 2.4 homolog [Tetranychus urticae]
MGPQNILTGILCGLKDAISGIFAIKNHYNSAISDSESSSSPSSVPTPSPSLSSSPSTSKQNVKIKPRRKTNKNTFHMICQCCLLNGCIFWFSLILFDYVLLPMLYAFIHVIFGSQPGVVQSLWYWMKPILSHTFDALWRLPVFLLTRVVNALWFQDIADSTYKGRPSFIGSIPKLIADTFFSLMIQALFLIQALVIAFIPFPLLGQLASLFHLSLLYALYSFEYKWSNMGWELHKRLQVIENNWPYFFGFGFPLAILTSLSDSWFVSGCIFSLLFPLFIISGNEAKPKRGLCDYPIKIFQPVVWFSNKIFQGTIHLTAGSQGKAIINKFQSR